MAGDHGWHVFDAEQGLEVQVTGGQIQVRRTDGVHTVILTDEQWEQVREPGPDPDIMAQLEDPDYDPWANPDDEVG